MMGQRITLICFSVLWLAAGCAVGPSPEAVNVRVPEMVRVPNHQLPPLESADITQASIALGAVSVAAARQLELAGLTWDFWPRAITRSLREIERESREGDVSGPKPIEGIIGLEPDMTPPPPERQLSSKELYIMKPDRTPNTAQRLAVDDRVFYIAAVRPDRVDPDLIRLPPPDRSPTVPFVLLAIEEEDADKGTALFVTEGELWRIPEYGHAPQRPHVTRSFAAVPWGEDLAVIYRDRGGIFARRLKTQGTSLEFDQERWLIAPGPESVGYFRLRARMDAMGDLHLLWKETGDKLFYCKTALQPRAACQHKTTLTDSVQSSNFNLIVQDGRVYVTWVDDRLAGRYWDIRLNAFKLFVAVSVDRGQNFSPPVSVNRPKQNSDAAMKSYTLPAAGGGLLLYWAPKHTGAWALDEEIYRAGWLDADLKTLHVATNPVPGQQLFDTLARLTKDYHKNLGR